MDDGRSGQVLGLRGLCVTAAGQGRIAEIEVETVEPAAFVDEGMAVGPGGAGDPGLCDIAAAGGEFLIAGKTQRHVAQRPWQQVGVMVGAHDHDLDPVAEPVWAVSSTPATWRRSRDISARTAIVRPWSPVANMRPSGLRARETKVLFEGPAWQSASSWPVATSRIKA